MPFRSVSHYVLRKYGLLWHDMIPRAVRIERCLNDFDLIRRNKCWTSSKTVFIRCRVSPPANMSHRFSQRETGKDELRMANEHDFLIWICSRVCLMLLINGDKRTSQFYFSCCLKDHSWCYSFAFGIWWFYCFEKGCLTAKTKTIC